MPGISIKSHIVLRLFTLIFVATIVHTNFLLLPFAQDINPTPVPEDAPPQAPEQIDIAPTARDEQIQTRLSDILMATGWFIDPEIDVQDGVVFLDGQAQTEEFRDWAGNLARNTQDVTAVVNQLEIVDPPLLDFNPIMDGLRQQGRNLLRSIPIIGFSIIILAVAWGIARIATGVLRGYLKQWDFSILLRNVISRSMGILIFLTGLYFVFQVAGLTNIAFTILGGTGLLGLILGIAFRDITENFLASIFLSIQNPFSIGDLVEIGDVLGFVQRMTTRTTILMTLAGNHVQIPNATVYKSIIHNYTSNPNRRVDFMIGIGYEDSITLAQETIRRVLHDHPAVLNDPEQLVLVDSLGSATINLQVYFWLDGSQHSLLKVKSSVIRLVKRAVEEAGVSMPDEAREMIFPQGVPVQMITTPLQDDLERHTQPPVKVDDSESETISTSAEGGLKSEAQEIEAQAQKSRTPEAGENLLKSPTER